jgi:hypothetical protein
MVRRRYFVYTCAGFATLYLWLDVILLSSTQKSRKETAILPLEQSSLAASIANNTFAQEDNKQKPILFLHVGPHKTGTTSIQNSFNVNPVLSKDNYFFLGMRNPARIRDTFGVRAGLREFRNTKSHAFLERLRRESQRSNKNLILSSEDFSLMLNARDIHGTHFFTLLQQALPRHDIQVAVGYRRYHEWLVSLYNEIHKVHKHGEAFVTWYRRRRNSRRRGPHKYCNHVYSEMKKHFKNVQIINVHSPSNDGDLMSNVYCDMMSNATHSCQWHTTMLQQQEDDSAVTALSITKANPSVPLWPLAIANEAVHRGLVAIATNITVLAQQVQAFARSIDYTLPLACLSQEEEAEILNQALRYEEALLPDFFHSPHGEAQLRTEFDGLVKANKLCSVNAAHVVRDARWRAFWKSGGATIKV